MFAGAAFTDSADIKATEAVDMLTALGVIDGYADGSFKPNGTVTRAQMAKMIYVARTGSANADSYKSAVTSFTDVNNHWAAGYIKYCQANGIIAGKSATKFVPDATVTGVEAAKMLLVTMGYQPAKCGLTGAGWDQKTIGLASENKLLDDVDADLYSALPRQYAAQIIYNTLNADRVVWSTDANGFDWYTDKGGNRETVGEKYLKLCTDVGTLTSIDEDTLTISIASADVDQSYHAAGSYSFTKVSKDYSSLLGQKVRVMFKDGKLNNVLGVYADVDNNSYTVVANAAEKDGDKVKFNGKSYSVEYKMTRGTKTAVTTGGTGLITYRDGDQVNSIDVADVDAMATSADVLTFVDTDGNNKIDTVYIQTVLVKKVTYVSSSQIVAGGTTYKTEDENIADGLKKDDWVVITENKYNGNKDIVKADMIQTTINGYKDKTNKTPARHQYRVDGTWYNTADAKELDAKAGDKADIVVYNGIIFYADKVSGSSGSADVAMVVDTGSFNQVKLAFFDGTVKTVTLDTDGLTSLTKGNVYVYEVNGDEYKLSTLNAPNLDNDDYTILTATLKDSANQTLSGTAKPETVNGTPISDTAKVLLYSTTKNSSKLITGKQLKALAYSAAGKWTAVDATAALSEKVDGMKKASIIAVTVTGDMADDFQTNDNYAVVTSDSYKYDSDYICYKVFDGENEITVTEKKSGATRSKGNIVGYSSITDEKVIEDVTVYTEGNVNATSNTANRYAIGAIQGVNTKGDEITVDGTNTLKITNDTKVILVDSDAENGKDDFVGVPGSTISKSNEADEIADTDMYYYNAAYILDASVSNGKADLTVLVVDVKNRLYNTKETAATVSTLTSVTATINGAAVAPGTTTLAKGDVMVVTGTGDGAKDLTLTNAKFADGSTTKTNVASGTFTFEVYATGAGAVSVVLA